MIIKNFKVKNFRNIKTADFLFSDKTNIISGNNAQGKTNLMEAIACAVEKSFRTNKAAELLPEGLSERCEIEAGFYTDKYPEKENIISCLVSKNKTAKRINGIFFKDALQLYPQLKTIVFIPEDLYIVKGNPDRRRDLCDETADMMNKVHHERTAVYLRALKQKNTFLSNLTDSKLKEEQRLQLAVWNEELAKAGVNVMCGRLKYFSTLSKYTCEYYKELNKYGETLEMEYISSVAEDYEALSDNGLILNIYMDKLRAYSEKEILLGHTLVGVHRDDVEFKINGRPAKDFASQGQIRSIAVAIRLAQAKMFGEKWGEEPIVILDDVLSELDEYRRDFILKHIVKSQVFITGCNENDFGSIENGDRWKAVNGEFIKI